MRGIKQRRQIESEKERNWEKGKKEIEFGLYSIWVNNFARNDGRKYSQVCVICALTSFHDYWAFDNISGSRKNINRKIQCWSPVLVEISISRLYCNTLALPEVLLWLRQILRSCISLPYSQPHNDPKQLS